MKTKKNISGVQISDGETGREGDEWEWELNVLLEEVVNGETKA